MALQQHLVRAADSAPAITYGGAAGTIAFWGLNVSEICAIISTLVAVIGLGMQIWLASKRLRAVERSQGVTKKVVSAIAESHRTVAGKIETLEKPGD